MDDSKTVEGTVDELLLGDGFSVVDTDGGNDQPDNKPSSNEEKEEEPKKEKESIKTEIEEEKAVVDVDEKEDEVVPKEEISTDDAKVNGQDVKSDALLITTEEDLEMAEKEKKSETDIKEDESKKKKKEDEDGKEKSVEKRKQGDVWVSNITRHVKATDLKRHFSKHGKVLTAKIVTNGKLFFGYIVMENSTVANKCVKSLHGSSLDGRKIVVSRQRPDQRRVVSDRKPTVKPPRSEKKDDTKLSQKTSESDKDKKVEKTEQIEKTAETKKNDQLQAARRAEDRLRREVEYYRRENQRLRRELSEEQRQVRIEQQKVRFLNRDLQSTEAKLREERRKMERDREILEKNQKTDRVKLENDRSMIKKELDEVKKLREYFKRKLEEEQTRTVERRARGSSPYAYSSKRFRETVPEKPAKYVEERTRTPPSPPKLSSRSKRSPVNSFSVDKDRRGPPHHYNMSERSDVRHGNTMVMPAKPSAPAAPRNIWPSFHQEVWRMAPGSSSTPFSGNQNSYQRQQPEYGSGGSSNKPTNYASGARDFNKRDHYGGGSVRKY